MILPWQRTPDVGAKEPPVNAEDECPSGHKCGNRAAPEHTCPFAQEINNSDRLCRCCPDCTHECAMDI